MNKLTLLQKITIAAFILYIIWEITVQIWETTMPPYDPIIRADLIVIFPVLTILIIASVIQFMVKRSKEK